MTEPIRTHDAAQLVERAPATIRAWICWGWIRKLGRSGRQAVVDRTDVLRVDALLDQGHTPPTRPWETAQ